MPNLDGWQTRPRTQADRAVNGYGYMTTAVTWNGHLAGVTDGRGWYCTACGIPPGEGYIGGVNSHRNPTVLDTYARHYSERHPDYFATGTVRVVPSAVLSLDTLSSELTYGAQRLGNTYDNGEVFCRACVNRGDYGWLTDGGRVVRPQGMTDEEGRRFARNLLLSHYAETHGLVLPAMRSCSRCHNLRPVSDFAVRRNGHLQSWCRPCGAAHARERRAQRRLATITYTPDGTLSDRPFGVEIECSYGHGREYAAEQLRERGLNVQDEGYHHEVRDHWKIVTDSSVSRGFEVVSPILRGREGRRELRKMMSALVAIGATVNRSCGLHVHHDVTDLTGAQFYTLVRLWRACQDVTDGLVAPRRRGGSSEWCRNLSESDVSAAERLFRSVPGRLVVRDGDHCNYRSTLAGDRYRSLNMQSFGLYGTVEIRQHQGTLDGTKALAWVTYGQAMIAWAKALTPESNPSAGVAVPTVATIEELMSTLEDVGMDSMTTSYLLARSRHFAGLTPAA